jgi:hypothetical protein
MGDRFFCHFAMYSSNASSVRRRKKQTRADSYACRCFAGRVVPMAQLMYNQRERGEDRNRGAVPDPLSREPTVIAAAPEYGFEGGQCDHNQHNQNDAKVIDPAAAALLS